MVDNNCLFCKIIAGEIPAYKIYEDETFFAFLDINPVNLGHTLLLPKAHSRNLFDLPTETLTKLGPVMQKLAIAIKAGTKADGLNIGWNNEPAAGQLIFHTHVHLIPRFKDDGLKAWPAQTNIAPADFKNQQEQIVKNLV